MTTTPDLTGLGYQIMVGDVTQRLARLAAESVQCVVTSPPYYNLRDYGVTGQIGREASVEDYVKTLTAVFRDVRRVLRSDGTFWLNMGDSWDKKKQLLGLPWRLAFALQADGWWLRQDIIWQKPQVMPESVADRCTKSHEYLFLLTKGPKYYFDGPAVREPATYGHEVRWQNTKHGWGGGETHTGQGSGRKFGSDPDKRNRRSVWTINPKPYKGAHFATFPPLLVEPCVLAGTKPGDMVLDPFSGSGTTGLVALQHGRLYQGIELSASYAAMSQQRLDADHVRRTGAQPIPLLLPTPLHAAP